MAREPEANPPCDRPPTRPRWIRFAPFLGKAPNLSPRQWQVLGLVSAASLFDQYDRSLFSMALPQIQADLGIAEAEVGVLASIVRLGQLPALLIALAADHVGRRRMLLFTVLAYTLLTGLTAFAPDARTFITLQFFARIFTSAEVLLAIVVLTEELDPDVRGWGLGALFSIQACGTGLAAALLPLVEVSDGGWRLLYAIGLAPLLLLAWWRRTLPETERFERHQRRVSLQQTSDPFGPLRALVRGYPMRLGALAAATLALTIGGSAADMFGAKYLQQAHGWKPSDVTTLFLLGGLIAIGGAVMVGRLSDRLGRRPVAIAIGLLTPFIGIAFYTGSGWAISPCWILLIICALGYDVLFAAFASELFPTSHRSTAAGARAAIATVGIVAGLALESLLYVWLGSHWEAIAWLLCIALLSPIVIWLAFPETAGRTLEEIAPEPGAEPPAPTAPILSD